MSATKTSCKMAPTFCLKCFSKLVFLPKTSIFFYISAHTIGFKFRQHVVQIRTVSNNVYGATLDFQCQHLQQYHGSFYGKFTAKIDFPIGYFNNIMFAITESDFWSLKSLHTLFDKYLDRMLVKFEQNRMVGNIQKLELYDKKWLTIFLQSKEAILEDVPVT